MHEIAIIVTISLIIFSSPFVAKLTKLPTSVIEIVLGMIFGAYGLLGHVALFELVAEFGFLYLMFLAGLEVDIKKIFAIQKSILKAGLVYIGLLYLLSLIVVRYLALPMIYTLIFPLISVGLIAALKKEHGNKYRWLNLSMAIGSLGEVISIAIITIASAGLEFGFETKFYQNLLILSLFLLLISIAFKMLQILFWWYPELKTTLMPRIDNEEQDIRLSMALLFLFISLLLYLHLEVAFGAFIAGVIIATFFEHKRSLPHKLSSFGFGFLVPIFFIFTGSSFKLSSLLMEGMLQSALLITAIMITIRLVAANIFYQIFSLKERLLFGLSHAMPLTLLVAISTIAYHTHFIDEREYMAFILSSILEVLVAMVSIRLLARLFAIK